MIMTINDRIISLRKRKLLSIAKHGDWYIWGKLLFSTSPAI